MALKALDAQFYLHGHGLNFNFHASATMVEGPGASHMYSMYVYICIYVYMNSLLPLYASRNMYYNRKWSHASARLGWVAVLANQIVVIVT